MSTFIIEQEKQAEDFLKSLKKEFLCEEENVYRKTRHYYDSFDWRLYNNNLIVHSEGKNFSLTIKENNQTIQSSALPNWPLFICDFPTGTQFTKVLKPVLQVRALCRKSSVHISIKKIKVLNKVNKTISQVFIETCKLRNQQKIMLIRVIPLRGYLRDSKKLLKWIEQNKIKEICKDLSEIVFKSVGITPGSYSSKINFKLDHYLPVGEAARQIHKKLLTIMQQNKDGILNDIDTEFLHDYRVSVRRTRSLYGHLQDELPENIVHRAKKDFSYLGKMTNRLRDIDVYLLNIEKYINYMPGDMGEQIKPFFDSLEKERIAEQKKIARHLRSKSYSSMLKYWNEYTSLEESDSGSENQIIDVARIQIMNRLATVLKLGGKIRPNSPDSMVHKLRIECKKLRYLLEFYSSLFASGLIPALIRQLKILQDYLGEFNDYSVQQSALHDFINKMTLKDDRNKQIIAAIGFLIGKLNERQIEVRKEFTKTFNKFAGPETLKIFKQIKMADNT
jgi:CHAD domain-containing protein